MDKNPFEDLMLMNKQIRDINERSQTIDKRSDNVEQRKHRLQNYINTIDESILSDEIVDKYNALTLNLHQMVQIRKELSESWKKLTTERNEINEFSEYLEKYYEKLSDKGETTELMNNQIEQKLSQFNKVLIKQMDILSHREEILNKEDDYISKSECLLGINNLWT